MADAGNFLVRQLAVGGLDSNFSYLVYDSESLDAVVIDPCGNIDLIKTEINAVKGLNPKYILLTHGHNDHTSGVNKTLSFFNAPVAAHPQCQFPHSVNLQDHQRLPLGRNFIECIYTPGHTMESVIYRLSDDTAIFTGDTLFIGCCGYCDSASMFNTMRNIIYPLADTNIVFSGHDYGDYPFASLGDEKKNNPFLRITDYKEFCKELRNL